MGGLALALSSNNLLSPLLLRTPPVSPGKGAELLSDLVAKTNAGLLAAIQNQQHQQIALLQAAGLGYYNQLLTSPVPGTVNGNALGASVRKSWQHLGLPGGPFQSTISSQKLRLAFYYCIL